MSRRPRRNHSPEFKAQVDAHAAALDDKFKQPSKSSGSSGGC